MGQRNTQIAKKACPKGFGNLAVGKNKVAMDNVGKRKAFSIEVTAKFIRKLQNGESQSPIYKEFSLSKSTVTTIWKNRDSIISAYEKKHKQMQVVEKGRKRKCGRGLKWFTLQRSRNLPITGAILQA
ncbi:hypothetical protein AVEN_134783-1 [Araneus ventricosus]|uniref:HTH psq-type domain-containing protein n=1 Tax=Araneus ventricosus TaxID=182803 RepID=A0A4Y2GA18_ARAVE|nr:hypothetical protein AVEN_134783-1 [Araneus ventricosus]